VAVPESASAAHLVAVKGTESGVLIRHIGCSQPPVFVPNHPGMDDEVRAIDIIQAVIGHVCLVEV